MKTHRFIASPIGRLLLVVEGGALTAVFHEIHDPPPIPSVVGVPFAKAAQRPPEDPPAPAPAPGAKRPSDAAPIASSRQADAAMFDRAQEQFRAYFAGTRRAFSLPVRADGTEFQQQVWAAVLDIPYGETRSYKDLAARLGNPAMGRAIGAAIRANPLAILIPGHRVVTSSGGVAGYSAGPEIKRFLLNLEAGDAVRPAA